jgi:hypothetical protein
MTSMQMMGYCLVPSWLASIFMVRVYSKAVQEVHVGFQNKSKTEVSHEQRIPQLPALQFLKFTRTLRIVQITGTAVPLKKFSLSLKIPTLEQCFHQADFEKYYVKT